MISLKWSKYADRDLEKLDKEITKRIIKKVLWMGENFESIIPEILSANLSGFYKLRVGDYRIIYKINKEGNVLEIAWVGHRRDVYKTKQIN